MNVTNLISIKYDSKYLSTYNNMVNSIFIMKDDYSILQAKINELKKEFFLNFLFLIFIPLLDIVYFLILKTIINKKYSIFKIISSKSKTVIWISLVFYLIFFSTISLFTYFIISFNIVALVFSLILSGISLFIWICRIVYFINNWRNKKIVIKNLYIEFFFWYYFLVLRRFFNVSYEINETIFQVNKLTYIFNFKNQEMKFNYLDDLLKEIWKYQPQDFYLSNDIKLLEIEQNKTKKIFDFKVAPKKSESVETNIVYHYLYFQIREFE